MMKLKRSKILDHLLDELVPDWDKLQPKIDAVFQQGRKEGFDDMEIGYFIRSKMKDHYTHRTIQRVLPKSAKHSEKVREQGNFADKMSANEREPIDIPADKISITPTEEEHEFNTKGMGVAILDDDDDGRHIPTKVQEKIYERIPSNDALVNRIDELKRENATLNEGLAFRTKQNEELNKEVIKASNLIEKLQIENAQLREQLGQLIPKERANQPAESKEWLLGK